MAMMLLPAVIYAGLYIGQKFPPTERAEAGVPFGDMFKEIARPLFIVLWLCMWLTAATELGPGQWIANIFNDVMKGSAGAGILVLVWINGLMYLLRQFGGPVVHKVSPVTLIASTSVLAAVGLWLYTLAATPVMWFVAAAVFAVGVAFWWPSMLGITSEQFPRGGALLLALIGGTGSISTAVAGPVMGWINDTFGPKMVLPIWSSLPVVIFIVFMLVHLYDRSKGGYQIEKIQRHK
jgi:MFS family permease